MLASEIILILKSSSISETKQKTSIFNSMLDRSEAVTNKVYPADASYDFTNITDFITCQVENCAH